MANAMDNIEKYQKQLLEQTQNLYRETPISEATAQRTLRLLDIALSYATGNGAPKNGMQ
jgi:hypothetical protein